MKKTRSQYLKSWDQHLKMILASTHINEEEPEHIKTQRKAKLEADPEQWFRYYFPRYAFAPPAAFHTAATERILRNKEWYEVRLWSRELAKSTRTMMEVMYLTLVGHTSTQSGPQLSKVFVTSPAAGDDKQALACINEHIEANDTGSQNGSLIPYATPPDPGIHRAIAGGERSSKRYVLLISNSEENAARLLLPYKANLEMNKRIIQDYGPQQSAGNWQANEFVTQQGVAFRALGAGQSPRGTRNEESRPDIILFDDVDTDADCLNPEIIAKKWHWIEEAAIGTRSVSQPTTIIFCGNRISADCCIERATKRADHVDEINIRDKGGASSWPQKNSEADIDRVLVQKSYAAQQKEYFNNPLTEGSVFKTMAYKPARPLGDYKMLLCYTDPSYKATNDYKATVLVGLWQNEFHILKCYLAQATTAQMIDWHYSMMNLVGSYSCYYFMEEVFMQDVIRKEVSDAGIRTGRHIPISGDTRKKPDKFMRIESLLEPLHRNGQLYLNESERHNPHMQRLAEQFLTFAPGSRAHDDGPDAVEGAIWKINEKMGMGAGGMVSFARQVNDKRY